MIRKSTILLLAHLLCAPAKSETATIAVASNFAETAAELVTLFEATTGHRLRLVRGSSGKLYSQIANGAPFDVFLSADSQKPRMLVDDGLARPGSHTSYAVGALVVWSRDPRLEKGDCLRQADRATSRKIAVANPLLAPYGVAAMQYLRQRPDWDEIEPRLVFGENIAQALQFAAGGSAGIGLVARSQLVSGRLPDTTCSLPVPEETHGPIEQAAVLMNRAQGNEAAIAFLDFLQRGEARALIQSHGFRLPPLPRGAG